jgi:3-hydroxyacyl-[acyl-carrier-protein] dehydratase
MLLRQKREFAIFSPALAETQIRCFGFVCFRILAAQDMRFSQLDRITSLDRGKSITAVKCLSLSEEYLKDHFPRFPVMPGVLMIESMFQASMFLVRATDNFKYSMVVVREANHFTFKGFVQPGDQLVVNAEIKSTSDSITKLKVSGTINGETASSGLFVLDSFNLAERGAGDPATDQFMIHKFRLTFRRLCNQLDDSNLFGIADLKAVTASADT